MINWLIVAIIRSYYWHYFTFRHLSSQQKALILAFAETEKDVNGTVNGVVNTDKGKTLTVELSRNSGYGAKWTE